ncbi:MAG: hypothetical protein WCW52_00815 [Elusimicrobiales bacterium]
MKAQQNYAGRPHSSAVLLAAAKGYVGVGSGRTIEVVLDAEDARVMDITLDKYSKPEADWREDIRAKLDKKIKAEPAI